jgi:hypothetical protein
MAEPEHISKRNDVVLWTKGPIVCTCLNTRPDYIEVLLVVDDVQIQREQFSDPDAAARFALRKMHAYNAH